MRLREVWVCGLGVALAVSVSACGGSQQPAQRVRAAGGIVHVRLWVRKWMRRRRPT